MISFDTQIVLSSSTTTVSSFSSAFSCLCSSSSLPSSQKTKNNTHNRRNSSSFSSSSSFVISSLTSPLSLLFAIAILSVLMRQQLVAAELTTTPKYWISWKYGPDNRNQLGGKNSSFAKNSHFAKNIFPDDMTQNDEPPRDFSESGVPKSWNQQSQHRMYYLQAGNDQYLQMYDGKVTGTTESKPPFGIVRFFSHNEKLVIRSFIDNKYLCMNEASELYLSNKEDDPECLIVESTVPTNGSYNTDYHFPRYQTGKKRYLGINCDPVLGSETEHNQKSSKFTRIDIDEKDAEAVKESVKRFGGENFVKKKCVSPADRKRAAKAKRQKLRWRWCLNIDRMIQKRIHYMQKCMQRESPRNCDRSGNGNNSKRCVCNILKNMLSKPKRARRKCLIEKLTKWIQKKKEMPNSKAVVEASKLLVRNYAAIVRRWRLLKARKERKRQRLYDKSQLEKKAQIDKHQTTSESSISHQIRHETSKTKKRRTRRRRIIKLNSILKKYGNQLFISSPGIHLNEQPITTERTISASHVTQVSIIRKNNEPSVLSDEFKRVLNSLSSDPHRRRRHRGHRRKRRKHRHTNLKSAPNEPEIQNSFVNGVSNIKTSAGSPG